MKNVVEIKFEINNFISFTILFQISTTHTFTYTFKQTHKLMTEMVVVARQQQQQSSGCGGERTKEGCSKEVSLLELILAVFRKSMAACRVEDDDRIEDPKSKFNQMEIGWPTDVKHLSHVTFDRFHGFLGLPVEFEIECSSPAPSARYSNFCTFFLIFLPFF